MGWAMSGDSVLRVRARCRRTVPSLIVVPMKLPVTNSIVCVHQKKMYVYVINKWNIELMGFGC